MKGLNFQIDAIPLAIRSRFGELDRLIASLEDQNARTEDDILALCEKIDAHKRTIEARCEEIAEIRRERDILAFAVQSYQDETPRPEPIAEIDGSDPEKPLTLTERIREEAMRRPATAREIADRLGISYQHVRATLSQLAQRGKLSHVGTIWGGTLPPQDK